MFDYYFGEIRKELNLFERFLTIDCNCSTSAPFISRSHWVNFLLSSSETKVSEKKKKSGEKEEIWRKKEETNLDQLRNIYYSVFCYNINQKNKKKTRINFNIQEFLMALFYDRAIWDSFFLSFFSCFLLFFSIKIYF